MTQALRERTVERLKSGKLDIVVATDVAARGLDVERMTHVVNYDIPHDVEGYIHRIGRTGRAGRAGHAILFVMPRERRMLAAIERATRQTVTPMYCPRAKPWWIAGRRSSSSGSPMCSAARISRSSSGSWRATRQSTARSRTTIAAALAYLAQKDRPLQPPADSPRRREETGARAGCARAGQASRYGRPSAARRAAVQAAPARRGTAERHRALSDRGRPRARRAAGQHRRRDRQRSRHRRGAHRPHRHLRRVLDRRPSRRHAAGDPATHCARPGSADSSSRSV